MSVVPLTDLQNHLQMRPGANDELQSTLDAAEDHVASKCGPLQAESRTVTAHPSGEHLVLPVVRIVEVTAVRDPEGQPVTIAACEVNKLSGIIRVPYRRRGAWEADVVVGKALPAALHEAILIIAKQLWDTQRAASGGTAARPPGMAGDDAGSNLPMGVLVPRRAELLMQPYLLPQAFA